jgi:uncharacterized protein (TIGR02145 family)
MKKLITLILLLSFTIKAQDVKIGTQTWTTKNLDVTKYRNGDAIPQVQVPDSNAWLNLTTGAWCYYENKTANGTTYGKLYNWFAVNDARGLAPKGYHIPTDAEWAILTDYLGGKTGKKMKSTSGWKKVYGWNYNPNGDNTSGFAGLPGGVRNSDGNFYAIGQHGKWWSSSESYSSHAGYFLLTNNSDINYTEPDNKVCGFSVRCIKD